MNCVMTIGTAVDQGQTRAVVVRRVALQAQRRLAHREQVLVRRTMRGMTLEATLVDRRVLEREGTLILGMAAETEFVGVGHLQIVARAAAMRIMTVHAAHLGFANRVVVGKIGFGILRLVAPQAVLILSPARLDRPLLAMLLAMNGVAIAALDVLCLVGSRKPVANMIGFRVATQTDTVRLLGGAVTEADDFVFRFARVSARRHV